MPLANMTTAAAVYLLTHLLVAAAPVVMLASGITIASLASYASRRGVGQYSGWLKLMGQEHYETLREANNYAWSLGGLNRFKEVKTLMRKTLPAARRVLGKNDVLMIRMRWVYAIALYQDPGATLDDLREAVASLEETERIARRVLGGAHPLTAGIDTTLRNARVVLRARESLLAQYLLYGASALAITAFALFRRR